MFNARNKKPFVSDESKKKKKKTIMMQKYQKFNIYIYIYNT